MNMAITPTTDVHSVEPPHPLKETPVRYYRFVPSFFAQRFGKPVSRNSLDKYLHDRPGFPVKRFGPYVKMPIYHSIKNVMTTVEAMERWYRKVIELERLHGIRDGRNWPEADGLLTPKRVA